MPWFESFRFFTWGLLTRLEQCTWHSFVNRRENCLKKTQYLCVKYHHVSYHTQSVVLSTWKASTHTCLWLCNALCSNFTPRRVPWHLFKHIFKGKAKNKYFERKPFCYAIQLVWKKLVQHSFSPQIWKAEQSFFRIFLCAWENNDSIN